MADTKENNRRGRAKAPENESKLEKFERLGKARTARVLDALGSLEGLAVPSLYEYTPEHWSKIFGAINTQLTKIQERLKNPNVKNTTGFDF